MSAPTPTGDERPVHAADANNTARAGPDGSGGSVGSGGAGVAAGARSVPSLSARRLRALVRFTVQSCLTPARLLVLALPGLAILATGLLGAAVGSGVGEDFAAIAGAIIFGLALPLGSLIVGDTVLGAEVRGGVFSFTWATPARFAEIVVARWLVGWAVAVAVFVPAAVLAAVVAGVGDHAVALGLAIIAGTGAHIAMFVAIGTNTRRAAVWSLTVMLLIERLLGAVLTAIAQLSPTWEATEAYRGLLIDPVLGGATADVEPREGIPIGLDAVARLGLLTVVFLALATWGLRRLRLTGAHD